MSLNKYIARIRRLDDLIRRKSTGPPKELASKLDISERWLYVLLCELRHELDCPITYDSRKQSYIYSRSGRIMIGFRSELTQQEMRKINGGKNPEKQMCVSTYSIIYAS